MARRKMIQTSDFYCTRCGKRTIPIARKKGAAREPGHLKKLYCPYCNDEVNQAECRPFGRYNFSDFAIEFSYGNFNEDGTRKEPSYRKFIADTLKEHPELEVGEILWQN